MISTILLLMSGDGRSGLPTTAVWRDTATPPSIASMRAAGMLQTTKRLPRLPLMPRSRTRLVRSCANRTAAGTFMALSVWPLHDAVDQKPVTGLEPPHAAST